MRNDIYFFCPICDTHLDGFAGYIGVAKCPKGHYEYHGAGSYAANVLIREGDREEWYHLDDMFDDSEKLERRVDELRAKPPEG